MYTPLVRELQLEEIDFLSAGCDSVRSCGEAAGYAVGNFLKNLFSKDPEISGGGAGGGGGW